MEPKKNNTNKRRRKLTPQQRKKKRIRQIILFVIEILLLLFLIVTFWGVTQLKRIGKVTFEEGDITINEEVEVAAETGEMKGFRNIALFAVDNTEGSATGNSRTDTMIIASINLDTKDVKLVSLYRDTYLNLGTDSYQKANHAYAYGGPKQALSMLNMNLDLNITDFVTVGYNALIDAIDELGGLEIDVSEEEVVHLNSYQISIVGKPDGTLNAHNEPNYYAVPYVEYTPVEHAGLQTLNGLQATAYCRIRYVGNDYARTSRQKLVIEKILEKAKTVSPTKLISIAENCFPKALTSLELSEIISLASDVANYKIGEKGSFPFEGKFYTGLIGAKGSCIVPITLEENVIALHEYLFGETDYTPSETVKTCSNKIKADTSQYINY